MTQPFLNNQPMDQRPLAAAWRFRWLVLLMTILGGSLAFAYAAGTATTEYEATASLVVNDPRTSTVFSADDATRNATRYVEDQIAILRSDSVAQRTSELIAASGTGITVDGTVVAATIRIFPTESNEILVQYTAPDEVTAVSTVNAVIVAYDEVRGESVAQDSASAIEQLDRSISDINNEIENIEGRINAVRGSTVPPDLKQQYEDALARLVELQPLLATATGDELDTVRGELADIDQQLTRLARVTAIEGDSPELVRLYDAQSEAIRRASSLAERRDELLVDTELLSGGISLSSPAQSARAITTDLMTITILGALLGLLAGSGIAYLLALRRRKLDERAQPGSVLQTSMLAEIPVFGDEGIRTELPVLEHPASASAEAFRFAATALDLDGRRGQQHEGADETPPTTYLVTSPGPQEGKTVITANLALAAARKGKSVLAIDADFGNQALSSLLRGEHREGPGITEVVEAGLDVISGTFSLGPPGPLDLMSRGKQPTNAPDFFSLPATQAFLAKVGRLYDIVLIDGPPMLHVAYASILAHYVNRVVVVTRHGGSVSRLEDLAQRLDLIGTPLAGYVYNGAPLRYEMTITDGSLKDVLGGLNSSGESLP